MLQAQMEELSYKELQEATQDFSLSHLIGKGSHGCVYKASLLHHHDKLVAIKKPSLALQILQDNTKLENEINILSSLHQPNPYIVNSVGLSRDSAKLLVMDFMPNGSLCDWLHNKSTPPSWSKRVHIALQVAKSIRFLHEAKPCVVHRDIKPSNILFDSKWNARVADFGLAVRLNESNSVTSPPAGTLGYMDPGYTAPGQVSTKSDVYSFGVVLLEIVSCRRAIDVGLDPALVVDWALSMISMGRGMEVFDTRVMVPTKLVGAVQSILNVATQCVLLDEKARPTMGQVVIELENCIFKQIRLPVWRNVFRTIAFRRKMATRVTTIRCTTHEVVDSPCRKLSIRDVLAEDSERN